MGDERAIGSDDYVDLVSALGEHEARAIDAGIGTMVHGMIIRDPRRVRKGLDGLYYAVNRQEAPVSHDVFDRMVTMLRRLEWYGGDCEDDGMPWYPCCPFCNAVAPDAEYVPPHAKAGKHHPGCELDALLTEVGREG